MADGQRVAPADDTALQSALADEARLVRRVRWRLVAWSGISTLIVLLVLGTGLYWAVAGALEQSSVTWLADRVDPWVLRLESGQDPDNGAGTDRPDALQFGFEPGAGNTYLFAFDDAGTPVQLGRQPVVVLDGMPEPGSMAASRTATDGRDVRTVDIQFGEASVPARLLTQRFTYIVDQKTYFLQALQDRSAEVGTLNALLGTLLVGGLVAVLAAFVVGYLYASRALVPIRESLAAQRTALRRQREFAADASHELRTPLTVIRSSLEHLTRHPERPVGESQEALGDIEAEVAHLTGLVDDLLLLARSDSGAVALDRMTLDLSDVVFDAVTPLERIAGDRGVRLSVDPEPVMVAGDSARLRQLVTILVDNAIRHSPREGLVEVVVRREGETAWMEVRDQGPGVRPEDRPHVFDRFYRAPGAPQGGTGLGLSIAAWVAAQHAGRIGVANRTEGGAAFRVEVPAVAGEIHPPLPPVSPASPEARDAPGS